MSKRKKHNPEKRAFKGRSHKKGGTRVKALKYCVVVVRKLIEAVTIEVEAENEEQASEKAYEVVGDDVGDLLWEIEDDDMEATEITKVT